MNPPNGVPSDRELGEEPEIDDEDEEQDENPGTFWRNVIVVIIMITAIMVWTFIHTWMHRYDTKVGRVVNVVELTAFSTATDKEKQHVTLVDVKLSNNGPIVRAIALDDLKLEMFAEVQLFDDDGQGADKHKPTNSFEGVYFARSPDPYKPSKK